MAELNHITPNYYTLRQAVLYPEVANLGNAQKQAQLLTITPLIPAFTINESMNSPMISGYLEVYDSVGLLENFPLRGEERLTLEVEDALKNVRVWDLMTTKIDNVQISKINSMTMYRLHFITYQSFLARNKIWTKSFRNQTVTQIVAALFRESYTPPQAVFPEVTLKTFGQGEVFDTTKKMLQSEPSEGYVRVAIPRMYTQEAMDFLVRRAYSATSPSTSFRFFESSNAFHFVTDEHLFASARVENRVFPMTAFDNIKRSGAEFFTEFNNLESVNNTQRVDTLDDIHGGAYANRVIELDTVRRIANLYDRGYDYWAKRLEYTTNADSENLIDRHDPDFMVIYSRPDNARQFIVVKDYDDFEQVAAFQNRGQTHYKDIVENRLPYRKHLNSITVEAVGPPRLDIVIGDIIHLNITEISAASNKAQQNVQLTGHYLVQGISRVFEAEEGRNKYTMTKMDWALDSTNNTPVDRDTLLQGVVKRIQGLL